MAMEMTCLIICSWIIWDIVSMHFNSPFARSHPQSVVYLLNKDNYTKLLTDMDYQEILLYIGAMFVLGIIWIQFKVFALTEYEWCMIPLRITIFHSPLLITPHFIDASIRKLRLDRRWNKWFLKLFRCSTVHLNVVDHLACQDTLFYIAQFCTLMALMHVIYS